MELLEVQKEADGASRNAIIFGLFALLLAGLFGFLVAHLGGSGPKIQPVVIAAKTVGALTPLTADHLKVVEFPVGSLPEGVFFDAVDKVIKTKQMYLNDLIPGEPVLKAKLSDPDRGLGISQMVEPNMRAMVVQVDEPSAKAQIVHPGAMVDIIATLTNPKTRLPVTRTLLQNIKVLAVGDSVDIERVVTDSDQRPDVHAMTDRHRVVTVLVSLLDAESLALAVGQGRIDIVLRSDADAERVKTQGTDLGHILLNSAHAPSEPAAEAEMPAGEPEVPAVEAPRPARTSKPARSSRPASSGPVIYKVHH